MNSIKKVFAPPKFAGDEFKTHQAFLLNVLLWALIFLPVPYVIFVIFSKPEQLSRALGQALFGEVVNFFLLWLMHRGQVRAAARMQVALFWLFFSFNAITGAGLQGVSYLLGYSLVIVIAGVLLGGKGAFLIAFLSTLSGLIMLYGTQSGWLQASFTDSPMGVWIISAIFFPVTTLLQYLAERTLRQALNRTQQEITERQLGEERLRQSEERYRRAITELGAVPYVRDDLTRTYSFMGEGIYEMTGYTAQETSPALNNQIIEENYMVGDLARFSVPEAIRLVREGKIQTWRCDSRIRTRSGEQRWITDRSVPIYDKHQGLQGAIGVLQDVTERKQIEAKLRASLQEKEVLLKEVHHRVKNNMQVIVSMMNLQSGYITDPVMLNMLRESQNRVRTMALVHEKLYQSQNLAQIDFREYLQHLASTLFHTYSPNTSNLEMAFGIGEITLSVDIAIPCGLIVNELISNALKHAYPDQRTGKVQIGLRTTETGLLELSVADDGVGFPEGKDWHKTESLGMQLVQSLVKQIKGTIEMKRLNPGTQFLIQFEAGE